MSIFGLSVLLLFELEFEKSTSTSYIQAASRYTKSSILLENSITQKGWWNT
ncbi:hypothetical protein I7V34_13495 [Bacillus sp. V3]|nr:hypothetical protein I7V34_13495 [Bacillus sp. V3]